MAITIKELLAADTISQAADKINFNFDQLLLNGGGPVGPPGPLGPPGPIGGRGIRGTQWFEGSGDPNLIIFPDLEPNDTFLEGPITTGQSGDGDVWEYNGTTWVFTGINLKGDQGTPGASDDWGSWGNPPATSGDGDTLYPVQAGTGGTKPAANDIRSVTLGGIDEFITVLPDTDYNIDDDLARLFNSNDAILYLHTPNQNVSLVKFLGGGPGSVDYNVSNITTLAQINLLNDDCLQILDPKASGLTSPYGFNIKTENRGMLLEAGVNFILQTGLAGTFPGPSNIELTITDDPTPGPGMQGEIILQKTGGDNTAQFKVGTNDSLQAGGYTGNIFGDSRDIFLYASNEVEIENSDGGGSSFALSFGNAEIDANVDVDITANNSATMTAINGTLGLYATNNNAILASFGSFDISSNTNKVTIKTDSPNGTAIILESNEQIYLHADDNVLVSNGTMTTNLQADLSVANTLRIGSGGFLQFPNSEISAAWIQKRLTVGTGNVLTGPVPESVVKIETTPESFGPLSTWAETALDVYHWLPLTGGGTTYAGRFTNNSAVQDQQSVGIRVAIADVTGVSHQKNRVGMEVDIQTEVANISSSYAVFGYKSQLNNAASNNDCYHFYANGGVSSSKYNIGLKSVGNTYALTGHYNSTMNEGGIIISSYNNAIGAGSDVRTEIGKGLLSVQSSWSQGSGDSQNIDGAGINIANNNRNLWIHPNLGNGFWSGMVADGDFGIFWTDSNPNNEASRSGGNSTAGLVLSPRKGGTHGMRIGSEGTVGICTNNYVYGGAGVDYAGGTYGWPTPWSSGSATVKLSVGGSIGCTFITTDSDERLKENIIPIDSSLERIIKTRPVFYTWKDPEHGSLIHGGFIGQELKESIPEAVRIMKSDDFKDGKHSVHYDTVLATSVGAIQELKRENDELKERLKAIEEKLGL